MLPLLGLLTAGAAAYVAAVYALQSRPLGRVLAVLGAAGAGACAGLNAIWLRYDRRGWSASPSGYGGEFASLIGGMVFLVLPLSLLGAGLGTWAGLRLSRDPGARVRVAAVAAVLTLASVAAVLAL